MSAYESFHYIVLISFCLSTGLVSSTQKITKPRKFLKGEKPKTFGMFLEERRTLCHLVKVSVAMPYKRSFPLRALAAAWEMTKRATVFFSVIFCECSRVLLLPWQRWLYF